MRLSFVFLSDTFRWSAWSSSWWAFHWDSDRYRLYWWAKSFRPNNEGCSARSPFHLTWLRCLPSSKHTIYWRRYINPDYTSTLWWHYVWVIFLNAGFDTSRYFLDVFDLLCGRCSVCDILRSRDKGPRAWKHGAGVPKVVSCVGRKVEKHAKGEGQRDWWTTECGIHRRGTMWCQSLGVNQVLMWGNTIF